MRWGYIWATVLLLGLSAPLQAAQRKMTYEEYRAELEQALKRESEAKAAIAKLEKEIKALKEELRRLERRIAAVKKEIYSLIGTDEQGVRAFQAQVEEIGKEVDALKGLSPDDLFWKKKELKKIKKRLEELRGSRIAALPEIDERLTALEGALAQIWAKVPELPSPGHYTVLKGDCLWNIAKKKEVYGDPYMWPRIYLANDQITNPDLIYPGWELIIPRGVKENQHLVVFGEWLSKIAGYEEVYGDPSKWPKIYEANRDQILDPNLIYPAQVLEIPRD